MKKKNRISFADDDRKVAIYARKSRITHKGDSIGVQFKQSADYAKLQLSLPDDYEFEHYEDKGLSGYYSDRPDFQRLLHDIENGKIKAVACYKLDRISRKTADLMRLLEYFERFDVTLLVCSNNINTQISTSKIIIQVLAIIAEFERDTITERIQDNLMELSKDGRWLGGRAPTGFTTKRVSVGSGKNKTAITYLVSLDDEKKLVQKIFKTFLQERSICKTATIIGEDHKTKQGAQFTELAVKDILRNPIYCTADERAYQYFLNHDANVLMDIRAFRCIIELISIRSRTMIPHSSIPSSHRAGETGMCRSGSSRSADTKGSYPQRNGYRPKSCWRRSLRDITVRIGVLTRCLPD